MNKTDKDGGCRQLHFTRHIGHTTFVVTVNLADSGETMENKILRIIRNEGVTSSGKCATMEMPQASRQSERSA